jgi:ribosome-binding factor A
VASKRIARLNEQLKRELSDMIRVQVRDPRVGPVTVTAVDTAGDIGSAKIYVRIIGDEGQVAESVAGLEAAAVFLRHQLGQVLRLRKVPELRFREDRSLDHAQRIEQILSEVISEESSEDEDAAAPSEEQPSEDA